MPRLATWTSDSSSIEEAAHAVSKHDSPGTIPAPTATATPCLRRLAVEVQQQADFARVVRDRHDGDASPDALLCVPEAEPGCR